MRGPVAAVTALPAQRTACQTLNVPDSKPNGGQLFSRTFDRDREAQCQELAPGRSQNLLCTSFHEHQARRHADYSTRPHEAREGTKGSSRGPNLPASPAARWSPSPGPLPGLQCPAQQRYVKDTSETSEQSEIDARQATSPCDPGIPATVVMILGPRTYAGIPGCLLTGRIFQQHRGAPRSSPPLAPRGFLCTN